jgi:hypothetical protein
MLRTVVIPVDHPLAERVPTPDMRRLGGPLVGIRFASGDAEVEMAARAAHRHLAAGPLTLPPPVVPERDGV